MLLKAKADAWKTYRQKQQVSLFFLKKGTGASGSDAGKDHEGSGGREEGSWPLESTASSQSFPLTRCSEHRNLSTASPPPEETSPVVLHIPPFDLRLSFAV